MKRIYKNKKTGKFYTVLCEDFINATNAQDGQRMVYYVGEKKYGSGDNRFVREYDEFHEKFSRSSRLEAESLSIVYRVCDLFDDKFSPDYEPYDNLIFSMKDDHGLDSLDLVEFVMECEREFDIRISDEDAEAYFNGESNLQKIIDYIKEKTS
jgi:acyl carrier protein